ncbi:MAG: glycoside hydrolase family 3 protein, partial [Firmicutes bacterium]|nr:glycoside hydrolase family 3 protein [Bacillota bacterium]
MKRNALALALVLVLLGSLTIGVLAQEQVEVVARVKPLIQVDGLLFKDLNANGELDPYEDWRLPVDERVENLVSLMTLEEKAGAMFHPKLPVPLDGSIDTKPVDLTLKGDIMYDPYTYIHDLKIINLLNNGVAPPATFARWSNDIQEIAESTRLGIPIMFSTDPRHGAVLGAHVKGNQYFSQWPSREGQLGLAATRNIDLVREFGRVVAEEYRAVGLHMILGPQIDLVTEPRWGRNAGCWSESAELTAEMTVAFLEGLGVKDPKNGALAMVKHWPGAG